MDEQRFTIENEWQRFYKSGAVSVLADDYEAARVMFFAGAGVVLVGIPREIKARDPEHAEEFLAKLHSEVGAVLGGD